MTKDNIVVGLDIGTTKIAVTVCQQIEGLLRIIGYAKIPNGGVRRGIIVDVEDTVSALSMALEEAERMAGVPINCAYLSIGGSHIVSTTSKGVVAVSRADGEITHSDVNRVIEASKTVALPPNKEIIHCIGKTFTVDNQTGIVNPIGMSGIRLEVESIIVGASSTALTTLSKSVNQTGIDISGLVFSPIAESKLLLSKKQKELGVVLVDIGGGSTNMAVFEEGELAHCASIPVGSALITNDITIGLRTSVELAEKIKINYGSCVPDKIPEAERINLATLDPQDNQRIERHYVAEIIHARLLEIFNLIREELRKIGKDGMLPAGVVFTGGGAKMEDLIELAKEELRLPAQIGIPQVEIEGLIDKLSDPVYSTSVGLIIHGLENPTEVKKIATGNMLDKAKGFFKQFLP